MSTDAQSFDERLRKAFSFNTIEEYEQYKSRLSELGVFIRALQDEWYCAKAFLGTDWSDIDDAIDSLDLDMGDLSINDFDSHERDQHLRRTLVRTLFAMIEGTTFAYKQHILADYEASRGQLSHAEYAVLTEEAYQLTNSGTIRTSPNYPNIKANIKFAFPLYARTLGADFKFTPSLDKDPGWQSLCQSIEIRNRLMHPKSLEELEVSDADLKHAYRAADWFEDQVNRLENISWEAIKRLLAEVQEKG
ncbi:MAG: hypothetical protein JXR84_05870 [Anaerolineae bacterium]|nr:hypothetical protein [Anaerolineae bacterium]